MHPVFLSIGPIELRYYGLMYAISFILSLVLAKSEIKRLGLGWDFDKFFDMMLYCFLLAMLGARLYYVIFQWRYYISNPIDIIAIWKGGLAIHGGIIGGILSILLFSKLNKFNKWIVFDIGALCMIMAQTLGRFGNFMNGDAHGLPTKSILGIIFPANTPAGMEFPNIPIHPVMLYEMVINLLIFLTLLRVRRLNVKPGFIAMLYGVLYSVGRFAVSYFRADSLMFGPFRAAHLISVVMIIVCGSIILQVKLYKK